MSSQYDDKPPQYFRGVRQDFLDLLPQSSDARILEIGCGYGETGKACLAQTRCGTYVGVEISEVAARVARQNLSQVLVGDVETIELPFAAGEFDAVIMSEVLEHLSDPWKALARLMPFLRPGALVMASSPNISHYSIIGSLLRGEWRLTNSGAMDRTHLRWFTPRSYRDMFEQSGVEVMSVEPVVPHGRLVRLFNALTASRWRHLFFRQIKLVGRKRATIGGGNGHDR